MDYSMRLLDRNDIIAVYQGLHEDFPPCEIKPLDDITVLYDRQQYFAYGFFCGEDLAAYMFLFSIDGKGLFLDYFAVKETYRGNGFGSEILKSVLNEVRDRYDFLMLECETPEYAETEAEKILRTHRIGFYLRNGFRNSGLLAFAPGFEADVIVADLRNVADTKTIIDALLFASSQE